jgi:hypothetical protein
MRGPTDVDDILNELKQGKFNSTDDFEIFSQASGISDVSVNTDDALSMGALLQESRAKKGGRKRRTLDL